MLYKRTMIDIQSEYNFFWFVLECVIGKNNKFFVVCLLVFGHVCVWVPFGWVFCLFNICISIKIYCVSLCLTLSVIVSFSREKYYYFCRFFIIIFLIIYCWHYYVLFRNLFFCLFGTVVGLTQNLISTSLGKK